MFCKKGFTLIELLIVVIIIGVLASLAIPRYTGFVERARAAEALAMIGALKSGEAAYKEDKGAYTTDLSKVGIENVYFNDGSAVSAGQLWYYTGVTADNTTYRLRAARSSKNPAGHGGETVEFLWNDTSGASWTGTHPGTPKQ